MIDRPLTGGEFWGRHPLALAFQDVWDRLQYEPRGRDDTVDRKQWDTVTKVIQKDYERYLRHWSRQRMNL